jgi:GTP-binding protein EngB required for normal cell division
MSDDIDRRLAALARAVELAEGRLEPDRVRAAQTVVARAGVRLGLGVETTVVALAGPTGAGKSSLFNAIAGTELARAGVRRPTTGSVMAAIWGDVNPELLDWLEVPSRHVLTQEADGEGVVLLDLPDYDSVEERNRIEVERVIELVDLLIWVVDPQKYADAALHDRYLRPLAGHRETMLVVLNQADRLDAAGLAACRADLGRLLASDGLDGLPVLAVSARDGRGLEDLHALLRERAEARASAVARLAADVDAAVDGFAPACQAQDGKAEVARRDADRLIATLADAAGVPLVTRAVARAHRRRGSLAAGWPLARWIGRLRPDPLKRLRLGEATQGDEDQPHTAIAPASRAQRSQAESATRTLAAGAAGTLPEPWPGAIRSAATAREHELPDRLDRAVAGADLKTRRPRWWALAGLLQRGFALVALAGLLWLLAIAALGFVQLEDAIPLPDLEGFPVPTVLLAGGLLAGLLLALLARWLTSIGAARRARAAQRSLHKRVEDVARELVIDPVHAELAVRDELCAAVASARGHRRRR